MPSSSRNIVADPVSTILVEQLITATITLKNIMRTKCGGATSPVHTKSKVVLEIMVELHKSLKT